MALTRRIFLGTGAGVLAQAQTIAPSDRISVGMIAVGSRSHELLESIKKVDGTEIVGVCDAYTGRVERAIERTEGRAKKYASYKNILADPSIDAVTIGTPDHWHRQMVIEALEAGKDVYCEKPLTFTIDEGVEIVAAAERAGKVLQVGSQSISSDSTKALRAWVREGKLGQVTMIRAAYNRNSPGGSWIYPIPSDASPETVDWEAFLGPAPKRDFDLERFFRWRCYKEYSGGIATDLFVHLCTTIHFVTGAVMPADVVAMGDIYRWTESRNVPDTLNALLRYKEGFTVNLSSTFNSRADGGYLFQILGTEGAAQLAGRTLTLYPDPAYDNNSWIVEAWPKRLEEAYYATPQGRAELRRPRATEEVYKDTGPDATVAHLADFFHAVRNRGGNIEDAWDGHHAASCAHLINASVESGVMKHWDFTRHRALA
ncbi:MAG: Gfo/Idh/MocA family oxidoreductase [Acidobacteriia bacterium]|nr:Gfo/Idh/MocA family oxidoreductase [Terriglobia bacterium]MYK10200.1 Gfo/Idh/MocA family oxidoreductase [Terriglobia bacterium]